MPLRVVTLNIWNRMGPWEERLGAIHAGLAAIDADIVGLQEVVRTDDFDQSTLVGGALGLHAAFGRHPDSPYPMGNAVLSRWPIARSETFPLPAAGTDERRALVFAEIASPHGRIPVFCTHLNWMLHEGHVRQAQVRFVADTIRALAPTGPDGFPPILVGDMNAEPDADEMRFLRGLTSLGGTSVYFADAFALAGRSGGNAGGGGGATYSRRNPFAAPLREPDRRIDYVFVRGPDQQGRGEPLAAEVVFDGPHDGVFASDHFGVLATLSTE